MTPQPLMLFPVPAPVRAERFDLLATLADALAAANVTLQPNDVLAVSSKYAAISDGRVLNLADVTPTPAAHALAERYHMNPHLAQLVLQEADHIFGGIELGFLLTSKDGILSPNAGLDRSNIPSGQVVLFPEDPYAFAAQLRADILTQTGVKVGVVLTDSWLVPGRMGTTGLALATAGFHPIQDERGKPDLFGNPMQVTQRSIADAIVVAAQLVMGERDEATPFVVVRGAPITPTDARITVDDVAMDWHHDLYIESLTAGLLSADLLAHVRGLAVTPQ